MEYIKHTKIKKGDKIMDARIKKMYLEEVAWGGRWLYEKGFSPAGDSGDVSVRDPETGLVYISGDVKDILLPYNNNGELRACDTAVLDLEGNTLTPNVNPTVEAPMHLAIYRARPDVNAIVHTHATYSSAFAIANQDIPLALAEHYIHLGDTVKCAGYGKVGSDELADNIVEALGSNYAALLKNHGAVLVADTMQDAYIKATFLENIAQKVILAKLLGNVDEINYEDGI